MSHHSRKISPPLLLCFPLVLFAATVLGQGINEVSSLPIITVHPRGGVFDSGSSILLRCQAQNTNRSPVFTHNGVLIDEHDPNRIASTEGLSIPNFIAGLDGEYVCLVRNLVGNVTFTVASAPALLQLRVLEATLFSSDSSAPHNVTIRVGQPAIIDCASSYNSIPAPTFDWSFRRPFLRPLISSDNMVIGLNGSLYIQDPVLSQNLLVLECTITNGGQLIMSGYIRLIVDSTPSTAAPPQILSPPRDVALVFNQDVNAHFECIVGGSPLQPVTWITSVPEERYFANPIFNNNQIQVALQQSDTGTIFTCSVATVGNFSAQLAFIDPPRLSGLSGVTQVIDYGSPLSLSCSSDSLAITWYWFRNGTRLNEFSGPQLSIASTVEEDSGSYQCYATNDAGIASSQTYVQVRTIPASITSSLPSQQIVFSGSSVSLSCSATGAPPPTYQWIKDGVPLAESSSQFQVDSSTGSLTIGSVDNTFNGEYTCRATNRIGDRVIGRDEISTTLTIITPTTFTQSIDTEPMLSILLEAKDTLFCDVSRDSGSLLQFSWTKDNQPLVVDGMRLRYVDPSLRSSGSINITRVLNEDAGVYVCTVTTTYNGLPAPTIRTQPSQVVVTDRPVPPTITEVSSPTSMSVQVIWSITSNLNLIRSFIIEIRPSGEGENSWTQIERSPNAVTIQVINENISPFTSYDVRVGALYIGEGSVPVTGEAVTVVTMEDLPAGPPKEVVVTEVSSSETDLEVKWQPPSQPNGVITSYTILFRLKESPPTSNVTTTVAGNITSFILRNLRAKEDYIVQVAASNSVGMGPFSTQSLATPGAGALTEPQGPFYRTVWFIVVMITVILLLIVAVVILAMVIKYKMTHRASMPSTGKYHVRPQSGYFGGGGIVDLTDDAAHDYLKRPIEMNAFSSPANSETLEAVLERETVATTLTDHSMPYPASSRGTATPQLPNGPAHYMGFSAPGYINPPSFAEAVRSKRANSSSRPQSTGSNTMDSNKLSEWTTGRNSRTGYGYSDPYEKKGYGVGGDDSGPESSSYSVQTYSDRDSVVTDGTEYSHLAGAGQYPRTYHHLQVQTPQNATLV